MGRVEICRPAVDARLDVLDVYKIAKAVATARLRPAPRVEISGATFSREPTSMEHGLPLPARGAHRRAWSSPELRTTAEPGGSESIEIEPGRPAVRKSSPMPRTGRIEFWEPGIRSRSPIVPSSLHVVALSASGGTTALR